MMLSFCQIFIEINSHDVILKRFAKIAIVHPSRGSPKSLLLRFTLTGAMVNLSFLFSCPDMRAFEGRFIFMLSLKRNQRYWK